VLRYPLLAALAVTLLGTGCSSTLNEYTCSTSIDCDGQMAGRCEASGHCSFADDSCDSGFRFGGNSGSETDSCVGEDADSPDAARADAALVDAGLVDAPDADLTPIADIAAVTLDCDRTNEVFDGSASAAAGNRTLTLFEWTLRDSGGQMIDQFASAPQDSLYRGTYRRSGTYAAPRINVVPYHNTRGIRVDTAAPSNAGGEVMGQELDFSDAQAAHRISFSIASEGPALSATALILDSTESTVQSEAISVDNTMTPYSFVLPSGVSQPMILSFEFDQAARYWIDNVSVVNLSDGDNIVAHGSGEFGSNPWVVLIDGTIVGSAVIADLPGSLKNNGDVFTIELRVTDSEGDQSAPDSVQVTLQGC
jgi:hypothetical protein